MTLSAIDMKRFLNSFDFYYELLYKNADGLADRNEAWACDYFDRFLSGSKFVKTFCEYRGDLITSDREAAAFTLAFSRYTTGCCTTLKF